MSHLHEATFFTVGVAGLSFVCISVAINKTIQYPLDILIANQSKITNASEYRGRQHDRTDRLILCKT